MKMPFAARWIMKNESYGQAFGKFITQINLLVGRFIVATGLCIFLAFHTSHGARLAVVIGWMIYTPLTFVRFLVQAIRYFRSKKQASLAWAGREGLF